MTIPWWAIFLWIWAMGTVVTILLALLCIHIAEKTVERGEDEKEIQDIRSKLALVYNIIDSSPRGLLFITCALTWPYILYEVFFGKPE